MEILTVWCVRFLQARTVQGSRIGKGPIPDPVRVTEDLGLAQLERFMQGRALVYLPESTGAGPCGCLARREWKPRLRLADGQPKQIGLSPLAWSMQHLIPHLQRYYEARASRDPRSRAGLKYGAKHGGGNGQPAIA